MSDQVLEPLPHMFRTTCAFLRRIPLSRFLVKTLRVNKNVYEIFLKKNLKIYSSDLTLIDKSNNFGSNTFDLN